VSDATGTAVEILIPKMTAFMEEAVIVDWLVGEGDWVAEGQPILELETDKASVTLDAPATGRICDISPAAGRTSAVPVGQLIARIVQGTDTEARYE
jgi:pyruvate/2-oxoglutarate dehydrogenase complex dihydrolipoamide acyltransferase (E2) component